MREGAEGGGGREALYERILPVFRPRSYRFANQSWPALRFRLPTWKQVFGGKSDANSIRFERASARARTRRAMTASFKIGFLNSITRELIVLAAGPRGSQSIVFIV